MFALVAALKPANPRFNDFSTDGSSPRYARRACSFDSTESLVHAPTKRTKGISFRIDRSLLDHGDTAAVVAVRLIPASRAGRTGRLTRRARDRAGAVRRQVRRVLARAQHARRAAAIATATRGRLRAALARVRVRQVVLGAVRRDDRIQRDVVALVRGRVTHGAAAEAVAAGRRDRTAHRRALRRDGRAAERREALRRVVRDALDVGVDDEPDEVRLPLGLRHRAEQTADVLVAAVVSRATVAVEEAVLVDRVDVVAGDAGRERAFVVIERSRALRIEAVDQAVAIVVLAVRALRTTGRARAIERRRIDEHHRSVAARASVIAGAIAVMSTTGDEENNEYAATLHSAPRPLSVGSYCAKVAAISMRELVRRAEDALATLRGGVPVALDQPVPAAHRQVVLRAVARGRLVAARPGALVGILCTLTVVPGVEIGIADRFLALVREDRRHAVRAGVAVRRGLLLFTRGRAAVGVADERVLDVAAVDRRVGVPAAVLRAEARRRGDVGRRQHHVERVRVGRVRRRADLLDRRVAERRAVRVVV